MPFSYAVYCSSAQIKTILWRFQENSISKQKAHGPQCSSEITAPRDLIGTFYVGYHYTLLHTKYISCGPHGFREEDFLKFFPLLFYGS